MRSSVRLRVHLPPLIIDTADAPAKCPRCGAAEWSERGQFERSVVDVWVHSVTVWRYKCKQCKHEERVLPPGLLPRRRISERVRCVAALLYLLGNPQETVVRWFKERGVQVGRYTIRSAVYEARLLAKNWTAFAQHRRSSLLTPLMDVLQLDERAGTVSFSGVSSVQYDILREVLTLIEPLGVTYEAETGEREMRQRRHTGRQHWRGTSTMTSDVANVSRGTVQQSSSPRGPLVRGGRPRGSSTSRTRQPTSLPENRQRPKVVCWQTRSTWVVGVRIPTGWDRKLVAALQAGERLEQVEENRFCLRELSCPVCVKWGDQEEEITVPFPILIFRIAPDWTGEGELDEGSTVGFHIAVAPQGWKRRGNPPIKPEAINIEGYLLHFFTDSQPVEFLTPQGDIWTPAVEETQMQLVGREINLKEVTTKPFFVCETPYIRLEKGDWDRISSIVVGEEGSGSQRRRIEFAPCQWSEEQRLPDEIKQTGGGWFYVRLYHGKRKLDSGQFRFLKAIEEVSISPYSLLPRGGGHDTVEVAFKHTSQLQITPAGKGSGEVFYNGEGITYLKLPKTPESDETCWRLRSGDADVDIGFALHRVWWALTDEGTIPHDNKWTDMIIELSRNDFLAASKRVLVLRRPLCAKIPEVEVRLQSCSSRAGTRRYRFKRRSSERYAYAEIPLREYSDAAILREATSVVQVVVVVDYEGKHQAIAAQLEEAHASVTGISQAVSKLGVQREFKCVVCGFVAPKKEVVVRHVVDEHWRELVEHLPYDRLRSRSPHLPKFIYQCIYCNHYETSDNERDITNLISKHVERAHGKNPQFRIVDDVDEIRQSIQLNVPHVYKCKRCSREFDGEIDDIASDVQWHLLEHHATDAVKEVDANGPI